MNDWDPIQQQVLVDGLDDYVGLWTVVKAVRLQCPDPEPEPEQVRNATLALLRLLLEAGYVEVGNLVEQAGFVPWTVDTASAIRAIEDRWRELRRDPDLWEICWLSNTSAGDRFAQTLVTRRGE